MQDSILSTLSPENWPFDLGLLPKPAYMVGGAVRDALLGRTREYLDLDFVLPGDAVQVARNIAKHYKAGFVLLDPQRKIARVVFTGATVDFAQQEGDSLETDLHRRDFTANAIAYNPHTQEIIDPLQGYIDLQEHVLKMVSPANLEDDPLRLMRAYRQASQLGFTIEPNTQNAIRSLAPHISKVAAERVRVELGYMLGSSQGTAWITRAWEDGLLTPFLKNATRENFTHLAAVDTRAIELTKIWPQLGVELQKYVRDTLKTNWLAIAKIACLVSSNIEVAEIELQELTYSRSEVQSTITALRLFPQIKSTEMSLREQYFFFQDVGIVFPATAILAVVFHNQVEGTAPLIARYLNPDDLVAYPTQMVSGKDIIVALNIPASPLIGKILTEIAVAQVEGRVTSVDEAIELARHLVQTQPN
jgi:tRNA nucleotidyltransferase (CCA-adding enzyme)